MVAVCIQIACNAAAAEIQIRRVNGRNGRVGRVQFLLQPAANGQINLLLLILGQFCKQGKDFIELCPYGIRIVRCDFGGQSADQTFNGTEPAVIGAWLRFCITAVFVKARVGFRAVCLMLMRAVQFVYNTAAFLTAYMGAVVRLSYFLFFISRSGYAV